jgi:UDP-N-acetylmuramoylalanine-D-glutamate ligase
MKYIYGLNISGQSIIEYFLANQILFLAWDDDEKIRKKVNKAYNDINLIHPGLLDWTNKNFINFRPI